MKTNNPRRRYMIHLAYLGYPLRVHPQSLSSETSTSKWNLGGKLPEGHSRLCLTLLLLRFPRGQSPNTARDGGTFPPSQAQRETLEKLDENISASTRLNHARLASDPEARETSKKSNATTNGGLQRASTMTLHPSSKPKNLQLDANSHSFFDPAPEDPSIIRKTPRSPGPNKLTSFFGWKTSSPIAEHSPTYSARSHSPGAPSSLSPSPDSYAAYNKPRAIDVSKANGNSKGSYFADTGFPMPPPSDMSMQITDMEEELREVSSELAGSIRREMELEDIVDRLQYEASQGPDMRRTSDYFSDSGTSSIRYPMSEYGGGKLEDIAKQKRISEQEKAQFKLALYQKLQDERNRRKVLETHVQQMGEQMQHVGKLQHEEISHADLTRLIRSVLHHQAQPHASEIWKLLWRTHVAD